MENFPVILKEVAVQILGFGVVYLVLRKFAWKGLLGAVDQRREKIRSEFDAIEEQKKSLARLEKDYRARLENIEQEARAKIQEAAGIGTALARDIQERARLDAEKMIGRAQAEILQDVEKAKLSMRQEIVDLSSLLAGKILREKLNPKDHEKLIDQFIHDLEKVR